MIIEPTEDDILRILAMLNINPNADAEELKPYRETAKRVWDRAAHQALADHLYRNIGLEVYRMTEPAPTLTRRRWWEL